MAKRQTAERVGATLYESKYGPRGDRIDTPIKSGRVVVYLGLGSTDYLEVTLASDGKGLNIRAGDRVLIVSPHMSNEISVRGERIR